MRVVLRLQRCLSILSPKIRLQKNGGFVMRKVDISQTEKRVMDLFHKGKTVTEIHQLTGIRIPDIEAIIRKWQHLY